MIKPLRDWVIIQRFETETTTSGGIFLPNRAQEKSQRGKVIRVGKGVVLENGERRKLEVKKGDLVLFMAGAGTEITVDSKKYLIMSELNIIAVIEKPVKQTVKKAKKNVKTKTK